MSEPRELTREQLAEAIDHAAGMSNDVTHIRKQVADLTRKLAASEQALAPLAELRINADQIEGALKRLGRIALRDEAYITVAVETLVRIMRLKEPS